MLNGKDELRLLDYPVDPVSSQGSSKVEEGGRRVRLKRCDNRSSIRKMRYSWLYDVGGKQ